MTNLFIKKSKKELLLDWILSRNFTATHEVQVWGIRNYHCRALRDAQEMAENNGPIRRMTESEQRHYFPNSKEGYFVNVNFK